MWARKLVRSLAGPSPVRHNFIFYFFNAITDNTEPLSTNNRSLDFGSNFKTTKHKSTRVALINNNGKNIEKESPKANSTLNLKVEKTKK